MLEKRQQQIRELKNKHERLKVELEEAKSRLMLHPSKWSGECEYDPVFIRYQLTKCVMTQSHHRYIWYHHH